MPPHPCQAPAPVPGRAELRAPARSPLCPPGCARGPHREDGSVSRGGQASQSGWQGVRAAHPRSRSFRGSFSSPGTPDLRSRLGARGPAGCPPAWRRGGQGQAAATGVPGSQRGCQEGRDPGAGGRVGRALGVLDARLGPAPAWPVSCVPRPLSPGEAGSEVQVEAQRAWPCWEGLVPSGTTPAQCLVIAPQPKQGCVPLGPWVAEGLAPLSTSPAAPWPKGKRCRHSPSRNAGGHTSLGEGEGSGRDEAGDPVGAVAGGRPRGMGDSSPATAHPRRLTTALGGGLGPHPLLHGAEVLIPAAWTHPSLLTAL